MYRAFIEYANQRRIPGASKTPPFDIISALSHFGKLELYNALLYVTRTKQYVKANFRGTLVETWTGARGAALGMIMNGIRETLGGNDVLAIVCGVHRDTAHDSDIDPIHLTLSVWENAMGKMSEEEIRGVVLQVTELLRVEDKLNVKWKDVRKRKTAQEAPLAFVDSQASPL